jgi:DNA-binding MarR family transcriptional regulator
LKHISRAGTPPIGELAEALVMDRGALTHNLKPLERDGLVEVRIDPKHRRNRLVTLTRSGRAKLAESEQLWARAQRSFENAFGTARSASLREALGYIASDAFRGAFQGSD